MVLCHGCGLSFPYPWKMSLTNISLLRQRATSSLSTPRLAANEIGSPWWLRSHHQARDSACNDPDHQCDKYHPVLQQLSEGGELDCSCALPPMFGRGTHPAAFVLLDQGQILLDTAGLAGPVGFGSSNRTPPHSVPPHGCWRVTPASSARPVPYVKRMLRESTS